MVSRTPIARAVTPQPVDSGQGTETDKSRPVPTDSESAVAPLADAELLELAHRYVEDESVLKLLLAQPSLPPSILLVLAERLPAAAFSALAERHGLPDPYGGELAKRSRTRPPWWRDHIASMFR